MYIPSFFSLDRFVFFCSHPSFSSPTNYTPSSVSIYLLFFVPISLILFFHMNAIRSWQLVQPRAFTVSKTSAFDRRLSARPVRWSYIRYILYMSIAIVDFIKTYDLAKRSRIFQTHRKIDVDTLQEGSSSDFAASGNTFVRSFVDIVDGSRRDRRPGDHLPSVELGREYPVALRRATLRETLTTMSTWTRANISNPPAKFRRQDWNSRNGSPHELAARLKDNRRRWNASRSQRTVAVWSADPLGLILAGDIVGRDS